MRKIKKTLAFLTTLALSISIVNFTPIYASSDINLIINHVPVTEGAKPIIKNGTTLVPLRVISESLGATVQWNPKTKQVKVSNSNTNIHMTIGNRQVKVNDQFQTISTASLIHNGSTMLPIRFVGETLNSDVTWDNDTKTVSIVGGQGAIVPVANFTEDPWARKVRTSNLPKNANIFPYIAEGVPNWAYEQINLTAPSLLFKPSIGKLPKSFFKSDYDYEKTVAMLNTHFDTVLNVDYKTINKEDFTAFVENTYLDKSFKQTGFSGTEWADIFVDHVITNKIVTTGAAIILPEMFWQNALDQTIATALVKLEVIEQGLNAGGFQDFGGFPTDLSVRWKSPYFKTGKEYYGLVHLRLVDNQIDYNTSSIRSQIHPDTNGFGGAYLGQ